MLNPDWDSLPDRLSSLVVDRATKQLSIERSLSQRDATHVVVRDSQSTCIRLNFPTRGKTGAPRRRAITKRRRAIIIEPLRGSDAPGNKSTIQQMLARSKPRRVRHGRRSTWVEEFLVQWGPEYCTFRDALEQYYLGFDIVSMPSLESTVPSQDLPPFVATKGPTREQR